MADSNTTNPAPADVVLTVMSRDGTAGAELLAVVDKAINSESVRSVADRLTVRSAEIIPYSVDAKIFIYSGPEAG